MIYTYQDGVHLPIQRDLIQDLKNYIECLEQVIPLENKIIGVKDEEKEKINELNANLYEMKKFRDDLFDFFREKQNSYQTDAIVPVIEKMIEISSESTLDLQVNMDAQINEIKLNTNREVEETKVKVLNLLSPFLFSSVYGVRNEYVIEHSNMNTKGTLKKSVSGLQYTYNLYFNDEKLTVNKLLGKFTLPHMTRTGVFTKEMKAKMEDVSDSNIQNIYYIDSNNFALMFENKKREYKIICERGNFTIFDGDVDITKNKEMAAILVPEELSKIPSKFIEYIKNNAKSFELIEILVDENDALDNNLIFDSMKIIAEQYGNLVYECIKRNPIKSEISIKIQHEDGTRNEKYMEIKEVYARLSNIGGEGLEIASVIGVDSGTHLKSQSRYLIV
ncbi:MAG: hypothetical protein GX362_06660 [Methanosarcinaceae archaeon]|nr:hypothetical protein [Methanosarcinaceae archaeon]